MGQAGWGTGPGGRPQAKSVVLWLRLVGAAGGQARKSEHLAYGFHCRNGMLLVRRWDGLNWAVLFNTANNPAGKSLAGLIDGRVHEAADQVKNWPRADQFDAFGEMKEGIG